eukprot:SAG22_NODE_4712_length_1183_cov_1.110701_2_plen_266_part_00
MTPEQRRQFEEQGFLVIKDAISQDVVAQLNARFDAKLQEEMPAGALAWYLELVTEDTDEATGAVRPRRLWHNDLIAPPKVASVLREICGSLDYGHLHPDCPPQHRGRFRLDHDNAHYIAPFDPGHTPDKAADFPATNLLGGPARHPVLCEWSPHGLLQDGFHGGPPLYHISCMYELNAVGPGDGGFGCIAGSHRNAALIGPEQEPPLGAGHVAWGKPPWPPEVAKDVTRVEGQPGDAILFTGESNAMIVRRARAQFVTGDKEEPN